MGGGDMICPNCGSECPENTNFCGICGYRFTDTTSIENKQDYEQIQDMREEAVETDNNDSLSSNPDSTTAFTEGNYSYIPEKPRKKHRRLFIILIFVAIILAVASGLFFGPSVFDMIDNNQSKILSLRIKLSPKILTETSEVFGYGLNDDGKWVFRSGNYNVVQYVVEKDRGADMLRLLIEKGADVNYVSNDGETPLSIAVEDNKLEYVAILLENGANVNYPNSYGETPLQTAVAYGYGKLIDLLLAFHADPEVTQSVTIGERSTDIPLLMHVAVLDNSPTIVEALIRAGADVNREDEFGYTALERCLMQNQDLSMITVLMKNGANLQHFSTSGQTPLMIAISEDCDFEIIKLLIDSNPSTINVENNGLNVIQQAIICDSSLNIIKYIVSNGADLHAETKYGNTLIDLAEYYASEEVQEYISLAIEAYDFMKTHIIDSASKIPEKDKQAIAEKYVLFHDDFSIDLIFITADASVQSIDLDSYTDEMLEKCDISSKSMVTVTLSPSYVYITWNSYSTGITEEESDTIMDNVGNTYWREDAVSAAYEFERTVRTILEGKKQE
ncbi:MAG: ankyrin repeat domain-containing protein [Spirochaetales bacterium]|nr:ankyrin repeat domain-containing protein [Spirochaetales bacterium]